jgi:very-short-patch-repair endonuclease
MADAVKNSEMIELRVNNKKTKTYGIHDTWTEFSWQGVLEDVFSKEHGFLVCQQTALSGLVKNKTVFEFIKTHRNLFVGFDNQHPLFTGRHDFCVLRRETSHDPYEIFCVFEIDGGGHRTKNDYGKDACLLSSGIPVFRIVNLSGNDFSNITWLEAYKIIQSLYPGEPQQKDLWLDKLCDCYQEFRVRFWNRIMDYGFCCIELRKEIELLNPKDVERYLYKFFSKKCGAKKITKENIIEIFDGIEIDMAFNNYKESQGAVPYFGNV